VSGRPILAGAVALALLCASACDEHASSAPAPTSVVETTSTSTVATTPPTVAAAAVTVPSTTVPPTTTEPLPVPAPAPPEDGTTEPRIELGTIDIPSIDVHQTMFEGVRLATLDLGPGHWPGTALPGQIGNVVVGGHRTSHAQPFRHLDRLRPGDQVVFTTAAGRFVYLVQGTEVVTPDTIRVVDQTRARTATLFACEPPHSTKYRIVVHLALDAGAPR
jgi:sortase A